ncbi:peptidylprolyl isomerase [Brevundimonas sp. SORGH_AS_0993]|uniref:peptidylprolyl isomerase n=1 Tax=Brevundimonas sp. SORGH_AS_0993 TaxID=3041794 RepID=UPI002781A521|nr:peptidylprolyl isomerase [Brevundimonas sp. SORGH_AS_0993]MDQ1154626.1 peptidyl-prolyl cis-trans isomerase A (cyclophilin A) [Brevundimonas sp. SORGH_AS_0993]
MSHETQDDPARTAHPEPETPDIVLSSPLGEIVVRPDYARAPLTSAHFVTLVRDGWLDQACFYRVVRSRPEGEGPPTIDVIQGGLGFARADHAPPVPHENTVDTGLRHGDGVVSLAKRQEAPARSEFFICIGDQDILNGGGPPPPEGQGTGFPAFAKVISGMDVVRAIHQRPSDAPVPGGDERLAGQFLDTPIPLRIGLRRPSAYSD